MAKRTASEIFNDAIDHKKGLGDYTEENFLLDLDQFLYEYARQISISSIREIIEHRLAEITTEVN